MLKNLHDWFVKQWRTDDSNNRHHSIEVATAVLFYEVMRADRKFKQAEQQVYRQQLEKHFALTESALETLCEATLQQAESAVDYQQFTRVINQHCNPEEKRAILDSLWTLAFADKELSPDEDYTIRKIADLLYLPHSQFIQSKLAVQQQSH